MIREELEHLLDLVRFAEHDMECTKEEEIPNVKEKLIQRYEGMDGIIKIVKYLVDKDDFKELKRMFTPPPEQTGTLLNDKETK